MTTSTDFTALCFHNSPCGIMVFEPSDTIQKLNPALENMLGLSNAELRGHTRDSLPYPALRALFNDSGLIHLAGSGTEGERWLQYSQAETAGGGLVVKFFQDVTELLQRTEEVELLRREVEALTITDELTGLANQRALKQTLASQVTRSRRYENPLSLAVVELEDAADPSAALDDDTILNISRYLRDRLRWVDMIGRWDDNHFVIILPETTWQAAHNLMQSICDDYTSQEESAPLKLRHGLAGWTKGDDANKLMERAADDLNSNSQPLSAVAR